QIRRDPVGPNAGVLYATPQWLDTNGDGLATGAGERQYPVTYAAGTTLDVTAIFTVDPALWRGRVRVRAQGPNGPQLGYDEMRPVRASLTGNQLRATAAFDNALGNEVQIYSSFSLSWQLLPDNGRTWITPAVASTSSNELYVTLRAPAAGMALYQSLLQIGSCPAAGQTTEAGTISNISSYFQGAGVTRYNGDQLYYYQSWNAALVSETTATLLRTADGNCVAWAALFRDVLRAQGITAATYAVETNHSGRNGRELFLVKNWSFGTANVPAIARLQNLPSANAMGVDQYTFPYYVLPSAMDVVGGAVSFAASKAAGQYLWGNPAGNPPVIQDLPGVAGQNNSNPPSIFLNHCLVRIGTTLYDPSYGK